HEQRTALSCVEPVMEHSSAAAKLPHDRSAEDGLRRSEEGPSRRRGVRVGSRLTAPSWPALSWAHQSTSGSPCGAPASNSEAQSASSRRLWCYYAPKPLPAHERRAIF